MLEKYQSLNKDFDHLRTSLLLEPRGHRDMYAAILAPPQRQDSHYSVIFLNRSGLCPMSAHGVIAVATLCLEAQLIEMKAPETLIRLDTPAGLVRVFAAVEREQVSRVYMENVPSFALGRGFAVVIPQIGRVEFAAAYGGEFYAYVEASTIQLDLVQENLTKIATLGQLICRTIMDQYDFPHPTEPSLGVLAGVIFHAPVGRRRTGNVDQRLVCVFADGAVDRSPSGTGLCGWLALLQARGDMEVAEPYVAEGILGGTMVGKIAHTDIRLANLDAVVVEIEGRAFITGRHCFYLSADDPLRDGFST